MGDSSFSDLQSVWSLYKSGFNGRREEIIVFFSSYFIPFQRIKNNLLTNEHEQTRYSDSS